MKLTLINLIKLCIQILTIRGRNGSPAYEKQLQTFMRGYESGRNDTIGDLIAALESHDPGPSVPQDVEYQYRVKPVWVGATQPWSVWKPCSVEQAKGYIEVPILHDWQYEVKALLQVDALSSTERGAGGFGSTGA